MIIVRLGEEPALLDFEVVELRVVVSGADDAAVEEVVEAADLFADLADWEHSLDRGHCGQDAVVIGVLESVVEYAAPRAAAGLGLVARLDRADNNVGGPQLLVTQLGLAARSFADGEHRDDG